MINTTTTCGPEGSDKSFEYVVTYDTAENTGKVMYTSCFDEDLARTWWSRNIIPRNIGLKVNWRGSMSFQSKDSLTRQLKK